MRSNDFLRAGFGSVSLNWSRIMGVGLALLLACPALFSQGSTGRILGGVTDQSGGNVAGATVTITDVQRGIPRNLVTDKDGEYVPTDLLPGTYTVRVEFKGFNAFERKNILL